MLRQYIFSEKSKGIYFDSIKNPSTDVAIVFIHGILASRNMWGSLYNSFSNKASLYFVDLLGFGFSAKPNIAYTLENHIKALKAFIDTEVNEKDIILVGHSLGALIAFGYTSFYPERIKKTILISMPYFHDPQEAYTHISTHSSYKKYKFLFKENLTTKIFCLLVCSVFGSITRQIVPFIYRDLSRKSAQDGHRHSYKSYISTLTNVIYNQNLSRILKPSIKKKLELLHGTEDHIAPIKNIKELAKQYNLSLTIEEGEGHRFPMINIKPLAKVLEKTIKEIK